MTYGYSTTLAGYARDQRRRGRLERADAAIELENPVCGDQLRMTARRGPAGTIAAVRFECQGCLAAQAAAAALAEALEGAALAAAAKLDAATLARRLDGLPAAASHAVALALEARDELLRRLG